MLFWERKKRKEHGCLTAVTRAEQSVIPVAPCQPQSSRSSGTTSMLSQNVGQLLIIGRDELYSLFEKAVPLGTAVEPFASILFAASLEISNICSPICDRQRASGYPALPRSFGSSKQRRI